MMMHKVVHWIDAIDKLYVLRKERGIDLRDCIDEIFQEREKIIMKVQKRLNT